MKRSSEYIIYGVSAVAGSFTWLGLDYLQDSQTADAAAHNIQIEACLEKPSDLSLDPECLAHISDLQIRIGNLASQGSRPELNDDIVRASLNEAKSETLWDNSLYAPEIAGLMTFVLPSGLVFASRKIW